MSFTPVVMPQMGLEVTEGTVIAIHFEVGARVSEGDALVELETDKAVTEIEAPCAGVVHSVEVAVGDTIALGTTLLVLADDSLVESGPPAPAAAEPSGNGSRSPEERIRAAPVARRAAEQLGVSLAALTGTGPRGRITLHDVEAAAAAAPQPEPPAPTAPRPEPEERLEPMSATRRAVARRMTASQLIPQFALSRDIEAGWLLSERDRLKAQGVPGLSVNDLLVQAFTDTLARHADLAASYVEPEQGRPQLRRRTGADIGLAVATERGLVVAVIRRADALPLRELAVERARLVELARAGRLGLDDMTGATVTVSNLAGVGVDRFSAMVNPGEAAILAVGRVIERVVPRERGVAVAPMLTLTLTLDHRVVDGATGGAALAELAALLEGEMRWRP